MRVSCSSACSIDSDRVPLDSFSGAASLDIPASDGSDAAPIEGTGSAGEVEPGFSRASTAKRAFGSRRTPCAQPAVAGMS